MKTNKAMGRRQFLRSSAAVATGLAVWRTLPARAAQAKLSTPSMEKLGWQLSVQLYTYRRYPLFEALDKVAELGIAKRNEPSSRNTVFGEGEGDFANVLKELKRLGYRGLTTIDFEHDTPALQEDMARNVAFVEDQAKRLLAETK